MMSREVLRDDAQNRKSGDRRIEHVMIKGTPREINQSFIHQQQLLLHAVLYEEILNRSAE